MKNAQTEIESKREIQGYFLITAASLLWGTMGILAKLSYAFGIAPVTLIALRLVVSFTTLFLVLALFKRDSFKADKNDLLKLLVFGVFAVAFQRISYFYAVELGTATIAAILFYTYPVLVTLIAWFTMREKLTISTLSAIILTFSGAALVVKIYDATAIRANIAAITFGLLSSVFFVLYFMMARNLRKRYATWTLIVYGDGIGALALSPVIFLSLSSIAEYPMQLWVLVITIALVPSLLAYMLYSHALKYVKAKGSILSVMEPLCAAVLSSVILGEGFHILQILGIALALTGVVLLLRKS